MSQYLIKHVGKSVLNMVKLMIKQPGMSATLQILQETAQVWRPACAVSYWLIYNHTLIYCEV